VTKERIRDFYRRIADSWDYWHQRNRYYHSQMGELIRGMVPPGSLVLELGSGTGDLLASLRPAKGVGLNVADALTERARRKHPGLEFRTVEVDEVRVADDFRPDYCVLPNMLDHVYDVWDVLENLRPVVSDRTLLIMVTNNPLWASLLKLGSKLGLRTPESPRNFITNRDIASVLELQGYDVVEEGLALPVPRRIPLLGDLLNMIVPELPGLRWASCLQYTTARLRVARPMLSCSVIVPCHNEADNIAECVRRVPAMGAWTEIIVVDDGSKDATRQRVLDIMRLDSRVRLVAFDQNQGKANAVRAGFQAARGDIIMILDADMAVMPEELPKFLKPLQDGTADFVNGTRLVYPMQGRAMKITNFLGNKAFCYLASVIMRQRVSDTLCGTKAMFKRDYDRMPLGGKERWGDFDLLLGAARLKLRLWEIPVHYQERRAGKSKMRVMIDGWLFLFACVQGWRMLRRPDTVPWIPRQAPMVGGRELEASRLEQAT
jgi:SAM-dependent methyltransferase